MKDHLITKQEAIRMLNEIDDQATIDLLYRIIRFEWLRRKV